MSTTSTDREQWSSRIGFVLAAAGSAIGLGNIWRFPYLAGEGGGGAFVLIYLLCILFIGMPYLFGELSLGRNSQKNPVGAIKSITGGGSAWIVVGGFCVLAGFVILSYYSVVAGWAVGYAVKDILAPTMGFEAFAASPWLNVGLVAFFLLLTLLVVAGGVEKGIERWAKILLPVLFVLILLVIVRAVTLEGAAEGLRFYLVPDFSEITFDLVIAALGQAFFTLSLGMGAMITYGSYLPKREDIAMSGGYVVLFNTMIALMAGFMIFPALFAMGADPATGPALVFVVLPEVFAQMPLGGIVEFLFFLLLSIAALTSSISLLEVVVSYFVDEKNWSRRKSVLIIGVITFLMALPSALSFGAVGAFSDLSYLFGEGGLFGQNNVLGILDYLIGSAGLAVGAFFLSVFIGWVWGADRAADELRQGSSTLADGFLGVWIFGMRYIIPVVVFGIVMGYLTGTL
ncbi:sodium-dependent transporter [Salinibacter sp.]|uniref:sodium-dependent transporter n=1 Tax=Salinibacter sp. TaxID=2065818 RepID=UPI0021E95A1B|nr:sodium-dependent transporter [Salinibacter sp.]